MQTESLLRHFLRSLVFVLLLSCTGCSQHIYTRLRESRPARLEGSTVLVYEQTDSLPAAAEVLGDLRIKDFEPWTRYRYDGLLQQLADETNRAGGNALRVTHYKAPSRYGSAGNRIAADMLLLPDSAYTASYFTNLATQQAYAELRNEADGELLSKKSAFNRNALFVNAGYAFPQEEDRGWVIGVGYQRIWNTSENTQAILGARYVRYSGLFADSGRDYAVRTQYVGPEFGGSYTINERFVIPLVIGFGYLHYRNNIYDVSLDGYGMHLDIGCEYRISYRVGVGVNYTYYAQTFKIPGIEGSTRYRSSLNGGVRLYF